MHTPTQRPQMTIGQQLIAAGVSRRTFLSFCSKLMVAAPFGLALTDKVHAEDVAQEIKKARRPSVIWLHFQDCTGCTETLLRTSKPDLGELLLQLVSLDYHETLMAASGAQAEKCLHDAMAENFGHYVLVVEGSIPQKNGGVYMKLGGKPATKIIEEVAQGAAAIIAIGSCASWGGLPSADPDPTGATGVDSIIKDVPVVNIPGCPPNPYSLLGVVLQFASNGTLPELDDQKRPKFAFDRTIHEHCPRRPHFDSGRFVRQFGDEGHRSGWCLYHMGCKGPDTHAGCSTRHFNEVVDAWPIGIGAPCVGCTEKHIAFRKPMFSVIPIHDAKPPQTYPPVKSEIGKQVSPVATAIVAGTAGVIIGGAVVASKRVELTVQGTPADKAHQPSGEDAKP